MDFPHSKPVRAVDWHVSPLMSQGKAVPVMYPRRVHYSTSRVNEVSLWVSVLGSEVAVPGDFR